ncbi:MAG: metallophosphoesterase [Ginsengibacter sp.]
MKLLPPKVFINIILASFIFCSCASLKTGNRPLYFIQMSDPQFGMFRKDTSFEKETINFTKAIMAANRLKPAFVIVTGDLVNKPFDADQIAEYKRVSELLDKRIPLYNVAGNHDTHNMPSEENIADYNKIFGADYYKFEYGNMLGIVLNSMYLHSPQKVPAQALAQEQWLIKTLQQVKQNRYKHIMVFMHHPWFLEKADEPNQYFNIPLNTRKKYLDLFKANDVKYLFSGHYHRNAFGTDGELQMVTTGPVGMPLGKDSSGFRIIKVKGDKVEYPYYGLDEVPTRFDKE